MVSFTLDGKVSAEAPSVKALHERRSSSTGDLPSVAHLVEQTRSVGQIVGQVVGQNKKVDTHQSTFEEDPIFESYKSLVSLINKTSRDFNEGKKWKCNEVCSRANMDKKYEQHPKSWKDFERALFAPPAKKNRKRKLTHSKTTDESSSYCEVNSSVRSRSREGKRLLVRQMATEYHGSNESLEGADYTSGQLNKQRAMRSGGRMPSRQWTVDGSTGMKVTSPVDSYVPGVHSCATATKKTVTTGSAFLLRPVSKTSVMSGQCADLSSLFPPDRPPSQAKRAAIAAAVAAAGGPPCRLAKASPHQNRPSVFSSRTQSAGEVNQPPRCSTGTTRYAVHIHKLQKQMTSESAPTPRGGAMSRAESGLPRQHSNASAYSAGVASSGYPSGLRHTNHHAMYNSYSTQGITMIRGASCSLVDIPSYLGPPIRGMELSDTTSPVYAPANPLSPTSELKVAPRQRPRLQLDLTQRKNVKSSTRKTKWTILCVGLTLLMMSVTIVGTMLSLGSQYQEMVIARQWENLTHNKSHPGTSTTSGLKLPPPKVKDTSEYDSSFNSTSYNYEFIETVESSTLLGEGEAQPLISSDNSKTNSNVRKPWWWPS